ncbi:polysaccharide export protein [Vibrio sp. SS-MA-C1-2]|uniref:polysaccharide biosynthesis/export family protein n=1 Tax=Vibrio sp. SS-MA-C1-2 TaxID=2908646 RepID=UPI001F3060CB|nr:polysaccharide biosynthesis/export family protein [Vibrio sp. SS-MA-C1-2]UJF17127.1 polysaccharide export protein [Vibrio sp. SS-MA-C1-2]
MNKIFSYILSVFLLIMTPFAFSATVDKSYQLGPGDTIQISVYGEQALSIDSIYISLNGQFNYPYLGNIKAIGKTPAHLQAEISKGLKGDYLINPKVRVSIVQFRNIYVTGEVQNPGGYPYQPGLTVDKAVALAGGFTERASVNKVTLKSESENKSHNANLSQKVKPGDVVDVKESFF